VCINNGSDTRIMKELRTLHSNFNIIFVGIGQDTGTSFSKKFCTHFSLIQGSHKSPFTILKLIIKIGLTRLKFYFPSVHVVDEQLYFFLMPILIGKKVTLDIFDSYFLKLNKPKNKLLWLKWIIYGSVKNIIVTDFNRRELLPQFALAKTFIIPNVPLSQAYSSKKSDQQFITICYFGTLLKGRGSEFAKQLIENNNFIKIIAAGWIGDQYSEDFVRAKGVEYQGIIEQHAANEILALRGDFLLAIYPANNLNNIYASPNKIYDAIHTKTPVIINKEIKVSQFVEKIKIGILVDSFESINFKKLGETLKEIRGTFTFDRNLIQEFSWEAHEETLISLHKSS
jgi:hypothetical protein